MLNSQLLVYVKVLNTCVKEINKRNKKELLSSYKQGVKKIISPLLYV